jgi:hypothetical protein
MKRHNKRFYIKALGLPEPKPPYQEKAEKALQITQKVLHGAMYRFLKLFEDTTQRH